MKLLSRVLFAVFSAGLIYGGGGGNAIAAVPGGNSYTKIADQFNYFNFPGIKQVGYGSGDRAVYKVFENGGYCNDDVFGIDPAPGVFKACWIAHTYAKVAEEHESFSVPDGATVRYGKGDSSWVLKTVSGTATCSNEFFGNDPLYGTVKECQMEVDHGPYINLSKAPVATVGFSTAMIDFGYGLGHNSDIGSFRTGCGFSHMNFDDAIKYPGQKGLAHFHTYFGNTDASAATTASSILSGGDSTCHGGTANRSAYWVPTMIDTATGTPIRPIDASIYYKQGYNLSYPSSEFHTFPSGLRMIGGTGGKGYFAFTCYGGSVSKVDFSSIPVCPSDTTMLEMAVIFPQCWDGANLTSVDQSHMSGKAPQGDVCPSSHPVPLTEITLKVTYDIRSGYANWRLSSDDIDPSRPAGASAHGDWFNGWDPEISDAWGNNCVRARADCHDDLLGDGRQLRQDYPAYQATGR